MANNVDPDQTAPIGAVCSWSTLFASTLNSSVMLGNYLQQTTSADVIFKSIFFLGALRVKSSILVKFCSYFFLQIYGMLVTLWYSSVAMWFMIVVYQQKM